MPKIPVTATIQLGLPVTKMKRREFPKLSVSVALAGQRSMLACPLSQTRNISMYLPQVLRNHWALAQINEVLADG
jgi:hypothetical protein